jgi:hypothetical protein
LSEAFETPVYKRMFITQHSLKRERDPLARKERILAAAGKVFAKAGFVTGSVREISRKARVPLLAAGYQNGLTARTSPHLMKLTRFLLNAYERA